MSAESVDTERLQLLEQLLFILREYAKDLGQLGPDSPHVGNWMSQASHILHRLDSNSGGQFETILIGDGSTEVGARLNAAFQFAQRILPALMSRVYALPESRPVHLLDRLERIGTDATNVVRHITRFGNHVPSASYLLDQLNHEFVDTLDSGRSQLRPDAEQAATKFHQTLVDIGIKFTQASLPTDKSGEFLGGAFKLYNQDLPRLKNQMVEQFRLQREAEAQAASGAPVVDKSEIDDLKKRIGKLETARTVAIVVATIFFGSGALLFESVRNARTEMEALRQETTAAMRKVDTAADQAKAQLRQTADELAAGLVRSDRDRPAPGQAAPP